VPKAFERGLVLWVYLLIGKWRNVRDFGRQE
jgi:hypothetical protein